jgi:hypothetical protein
MMSSDRADRIKREVAEIFESKNQEWITAISMTIDVMYQQFIREGQQSANNVGTLEKMMAEGDANVIRGQGAG